ncbi:hypothetical protein C1T17_17425 [Sphingobium sp. SCG-1]|uniref:calcium-binding protein n=1 Tax=Sphingobium sp. SCG-1 TaxID=2072936 RepID=UPI000CD67592|nr:calcium-binding protein [Sphingobium sp. SCG-1]AUW59595.1 hypothetical protein C1T17_17425 [Sphingobium sp. SCG-1]
MTDFTVSGNVLQRQYLQGGDTLTVQSDALLHPLGTAVEWDITGAEGLVRLNLEGAIQAFSGAAIDATGTAAASQSIAIDTQVGSSIRARDDVLHVGTDLQGGSINLDNRGLLKSYTGSVVDAIISGTPTGSGISPLYLLNLETGIMQSDAGPTIRLSGASNFAQTDGNVFVANVGKIISMGKGVDSAPAIDTTDLDATVPNKVRLINWDTGTVQAVDSDAFRVGDYAAVTNYGKIIAGGSEGDDGIDIGTATNVFIRNEVGGKIRGADSGIAGNQAVEIENSGSILGRIGAGIALDTALTSVTKIINHVGGSIRSYGSGDGIDVSGMVDLTNDGVIRTYNPTAFGRDFGVSIGGGTIVNTGTIDGSGGGIHAQDGALTLTNSGIISAVWLSGNFDDRIINTGTISGIRAGGGNDFIDTSLGRITSQFAAEGSIYGEDGDDYINAGSGGTVIYGGNGNDRIIGAGTIEGDAGNDYITALPTNENRLVFGGEGDDTIELGSFRRINGGQGFDTVIYRVGDNHVFSYGRWSNIEAVHAFGTSGDDFMGGGDVDDKIYGYEGNDRLWGGAGVNLLDGGAGDDRYTISSITTKIVDESGDDFVITKVNYNIDLNIETVAMVRPGLTVTGNWQSNRIGGSDEGSDTIFGGGGYDLISGNGGADDIHGGDGTDTLYGNDGDDVLHGDVGRDYVSGGAGNDSLIGGIEYDNLIGGAGADTFQFDDVTHSSAGEPDLIVDFSHSEGDLIDLSRIDAAVSSTADDAFIFVGAGAFTGQEGELRYVVSNGDAVVEGDVDGDGLVDFAIQLRGVGTLTQNDFLL